MITASPPTSGRARARHTCMSDHEMRIFLFLGQRGLSSVINGCWITGKIVACIDLPPVVPASSL
jgi:hypothetical protein